jgi:hypothetical protein
MAVPPFSLRNPDQLRLRKAAVLIMPSTDRKKASLPRLLHGFLTVEGS